MKKIKTSTTLAVIFYAVCVFVCLWCTWYFSFYHTLMWYEKYSYFSTLPDLTALAAQFPDDLLIYIGAFLLQFFYYPAIGAAILAGLAVFVFLCGVIVIVRLLSHPVHFLWVALLPITMMVKQQFWDVHLTSALTWCISSAALALVVYIITISIHHRITIPSFLGHPIIAGSASVALMYLSVYNLAFKDQSSHVYQYYFRLEHLAETQQWDALLALATPEAAQSDEISRRYAVLALLEKGMLADNMFAYSITAPTDFWFVNRNEPLCCNYNALLFRSLNMPNEVIHQAFQQQIQSNFGTSFCVLRRLAETNLEAQNYALAKKYMDILSHSTLMKRWVEERIPQLEAIKDSVPISEGEKGEQFYMEDILVAMAEMINHYPKNPKYADLLLCGLLAQKDGNDFYPAFKIVAKNLYAHGEPIPRIYQEALMMTVPQKPEILEKYNIDKKTQEDFKHVMTMVHNGQNEQLRTIFPNSFWSYYFWNLPTHQNSTGTENQ